MIHVGLTGNVASGKSLVGRAWKGAGVPVVSADDLAREAVAPGTEGLEAVRREFGDEILAPDGTLDRARLRDIVFRDPVARSRLESILHPRIAELRDRWAGEREREGHRLVVSEVPLLFEAGLEDAFDIIVVVEASADERARRLVDDRGLDPVEARRIMAAQGDPAVKRNRADHVIENDGTPEELEAAAVRLLERLRPSGTVPGPSEEPSR